MTRRNSFFTVLFSFIPGAGHMYLGMMKKGAILMSAFFAVIGVSSLLRIEIFIFALPVIWFYSFFDAMNLKNAPYEEQKLSEDKLVTWLSGLVGKDWKGLAQKQHVIVGWGLIAFGLYFSFSNVVSPILYKFFDHLPGFYRVMDSIPTLLVSFAIIALGIYIIRGKKPVNNEEKDFVEFGGNEHE